MEEVVHTFTNIKGKGVWAIVPCSFILFFCKCTASMYTPKLGGSGVRHQRLFEIWFRNMYYQVNYHKHALSGRVHNTNAMQLLLLRRCISCANCGYDVIMGLRET